MNIKEFIKYTEELGIKVTDELLEKLDIYANFLIEYNTHTNLTAIKTLDEIYLKHFYDSLTITKVIDLTHENSLLDIGTGAGFPGFVLKIFFPHLKVVLLDSNNKKCKFLTELSKKLNIDVEVINQRVEDYAKDNLNKFDIVTSRAVTNMPVLTEISMPLVSVNKYFIALKGSNENEINDALFAIEKMKGKLLEKNHFELPKNAGERNIVKVEKIDKTNINELRTYDKIVKRPLLK